jgi:membrane-associated protease RseP (regulator of RpoE activity)
MNRSNSTIISFAISVVFWWLMLGSVELAIGFLALIFVHEMGHYIAAKYKGLTVLPPVFTPMGAYVQHSPAPSADVEAFVSYAGPLFGTVGGIIALALGLVFNVQALYTLATYTFLINLLNMIPMKPLDGGGISMAIHRNAWVLGIPMLLFMFLGGGLNSTFNMIILIMIGMGFFQDLEYRKMLPESYFQVSFATRVAYAAAYLALGGLLFMLLAHPQVFVHFLVKLGL